MKPAVNPLWEGSGRVRQGSLRPIREALRQSWEDLVKKMVSLTRENHCEDGGHHREAGRQGCYPWEAKATGPGGQHTGHQKEAVTAKAS